MAAAPDLFQQSDALFREARRTGLHVATLLRRPAGRAARLAAIDDLQGLLTGIRAVQAAMKTALARHTTTRTAMSAYGRVSALRR